MPNIKDSLRELFVELNNFIELTNRQNTDDGLPFISRCSVKLLGQMSLLANEKVASILSLAQTGDLDAFLSMDYIVKVEFKRMLESNGLLYDEDSNLIWIPPGAYYEELISLPYVLVSMLDPESALVSKAVKAPAKNKQLIREAIASDEFKGLVDRILKNGGNLENFV